MTATVAEGLLEEANVSARRPKKNDWKNMMIISTLICAQFPGAWCFAAGALAIPYSYIANKVNRTIYSL